MPNDISGLQKLVQCVLREGRMSDQSLDALVSSRICHDLISPVGAIGNGVELLELLITKLPEVGLITDSVESAKAKLKYFRICFGQCSSAAMVSSGEIEILATAMLQTERLKIVWDLKMDAFLREEVKLLFLILLCVENCLPVGGVVSISQRSRGFEIQAKGRRVQMSEVWTAFNANTVEHEFTPAQVQFPLAKALANSIGREIGVNASEAELTVRF